MIQHLKLNLELMEMMHYFWKASSEREKVGEKYLFSVVSHPHMTCLYQADFDSEMARKVLSAISNREPYKPESKPSGRFWNNNMWMMEDLSVTDAMFAPIKQLNFDTFIGNPELSKAPKDLEIIFVPGHLETFYQKEGKLYINFFKLMTDFVDASIHIENQTLEGFLLNLLSN